MLNNFCFQNPTKLIMGKGMIAQLSKEIPTDKKIMITFGGGSVKRNGVYEQVKEALKNHNTVEFWGIEPNPSIETQRKAIELGKKENVDFLLAVGGGWRRMGFGEKRESRQDYAFWNCSYHTSNRF